MIDDLDQLPDDLFNRLRSRARNRCECCGLRNWMVGGRDRDGNFHPAQSLVEPSLPPVFPRPGQRGWCGKDGPQHFLTIVRIICEVVPVTIHNETSDADFKFWCQRCARAWLESERAAA